jgi:hypothetical protein
MIMSKWHYQLMKRNFDGVDNYAIHEYYQLDHGDGWSNDPVSIDGESIEDVKKMLQMMLNDIEKHGVKDYD